MVKRQSRPQQTNEEDYLTNPAYYIWRVGSISFSKFGYGNI